MRLAKTVLAAVMLTATSSVTLAQQTLTGTVTTMIGLTGLSQFNRRKAAPLERVLAEPPNNSRYKTAC